MKIIKDLGLAATSVFGLFIAIFIGIGLVSKEVERRSIYALLSKPVSRAQFIAGKYAGLVLTLAVNVSVMAIALYVILAYMVVDRAADDPRGMGRAGHGSRVAEGRLPDFHRADAGDGDCAVLLDVLQPDSLGGDDVRPLRRRPFQRRPEELRPGRRVRRRPPRLARGVYHVLPDLSAFDVKTRGRPRTAGPGRYMGNHGRLRAGLRRRAAARVDVHFLAAGLQVMPPTRRRDRACSAVAIALAAAISLQIVARPLRIRATSDEREQTALRADRARR